MGDNKEGHCHHRAARGILNSGNGFSKTMFYPIDVPYSSQELQFLTSADKKALWKVRLSYHMGNLGQCNVILESTFMTLESHQKLY